VFLRRNRWATVAAAAMLAVLVAYAATVTVQAARLRRQMATTERLGGFLTELMSATNSGGGGTPAGVRRVLDQRSAAMVGELGEMPSAQADLRMVLGKVDAFIGRYPQAIGELRAALATRRDLFGDDDKRSMSSAFWLGRVLHWYGEYGEAGRLYARQLG